MVAGRSRKSKSVGIPRMRRFVIRLSKRYPRTPTMAATTATCAATRRTRTSRQGGGRRAGLTGRVVAVIEGRGD